MLSTLILACAAALTYVAVRSADRSLLRRSTRVGPADVGSPQHWLWPSDDVAIWMRYRARGDRFEFLRLDTASGKQTLMSNLNRNCGGALVASTPSYISYGNYRVPAHGVHFPPDCSLSPRGGWLALLPCKLNPTLLATTLDGRTQLRWRSSRYCGSPLWLHNGHRCLELEYDDASPSITGAVLHDLERPKSVERAPIRAARSAQEVVGTTGEDCLLLADRNPGPDWSPVSLSEYSLSGRLVIRHYLVRLPDAAQAWEVNISPMGDRLAWLLSTFL